MRTRAELGEVETDEAVADQGLGEFAAHGGHPGSATSGGGVDGPAVDEHGHRLQQRSLGLVEQADAPLDGGPQCALALGHVDATRHPASRARSPAGRAARRGRAAGSGPRPARSPAADPRAGGRSRPPSPRCRCAQIEVGADGSGSVHEQRHRRRRRQLIDRHAGRLGGSSQRRHRVLVLPAAPAAPSGWSPGSRSPGQRASSSTSRRRPRRTCSRLSRTAAASGRRQPLDQRLQRGPAR